MPLVVIDAGHGGHDEGTKYGSCIEKERSLKLAKLVVKKLSKRRVKTLMTRYCDVFVPLDQRAQFSKRVDADLFVSLHFNSAPSPTAKGIEIFYSTKGKKSTIVASKRMANLILLNVINKTKARSRGVKTANFVVIKNATVPAILVEGGFITNFQERKQIRKQAYLDKLATGIANGIVKYLRLFKKRS